jgi:hypothetical protein
MSGAIKPLGKVRCFMRLKHFVILGMIILMFVFLSGGSFAEDQVHDAAMSKLADFFSDPSAMSEYASKNPAAAKAEQNLLQFPPKIQKRIEKVVLMIMKESGEDAAKHIDSMKSSGPESAFNSFSPAVQKEIQSIARELENDPEFMKQSGSKE